MPYMVLPGKVFVQYPYQIYSIIILFMNSFFPRFSGMAIGRILLGLRQAKFSDMLIQLSI